MLRGSQLINGKNTSKSDVINAAHTDMQSDNELNQLMGNIYAYIGILDELYPVFIVSEGGFDFNPRSPDNLTEGTSTFQTNRAFKQARFEGDEDVNFRFNFGPNKFSFSLPMTTASRIIEAIEGTYGGEAFATLDIPMLIKRDDMTFRRIYRIDLALPNKAEMFNSLR